MSEPEETGSSPGDNPGGFAPEPNESRPQLASPTLFADRFPDRELPDTSITHLQAALLVDSTGKTLYATEYPGADTLEIAAVVGRDWRELFPEFEEVRIESDTAPDAFFFVSKGDEGEAYRVRKWTTVPVPAPVPGEPAGHFILVEAVGDPTAVRELIYRERMVALGQIAGGVAHEVNNPLTIVSGRLQILLGEMDHNHKTRAPIELMNKEVGRIASIIHRLLSFGGRAAVKQQLVRVSSVLSDILGLVEYQLRNDNIKVVTDFCSDPPLVMGDPNQLKQVFLNIIVNARQAMPDGGTLVLTTDATEDGWVEIALGDTGCGMPPEVARKIFDPFYTTKDEHGGSGIGLFLCRNIVKDHGGSLTVSSRPDEGSTFIIRLPGAQMQAKVEAGTLARAFDSGNEAQGSLGHLP